MERVEREVLRAQPSLGVVLTILLSVATALLLYLCYKILNPFLNVLSWALTFAVVAYPVYVRICRRVNNVNVSAGLAVLFVAFLLIAPVSLLIHQLVTHTASSVGEIVQSLQNTSLREQLTRLGRLGGVVRYVEENLNLQGSIDQLLRNVGSMTPAVFSGSIGSVIELMLILFTLFFLFRDRTLILTAVRRLIPLSETETDRLFTRIKDTIYATLFGSVTVALIQGTLAGLMFYFLGIPAAILWAFAMTVLALIPYLGAFVVWAPVAAYLAITGEWWKAAILTAWGAVVVGLIDNFLYPLLVGQRLRYHPLPVFFFILGGVHFFGISGIVLGPLTLAVADAVLQIWQRRLRLKRVV